MKRILAISDLHCGSRVGLTPPSEHKVNSRSKYHKGQIETWEWYKAKIDEIGKVDWLFILGDCVDGTGSKSDGCELNTADREEQGEYAVECIREINTDNTRMVHGTPYHVGLSEDWENPIAKALGARIGSHEFPKIEGVQFDLKHFCGSSAKKELRFTALGNEIKANREWSAQGLQPKADILIRGHVHYFAKAEDEDSIGFTMPALQGYGSKYGKRKCKGRVNYGMVLMTIKDGKVDIQKILGDKDLKCFRVRR